MDNITPYLYLTAARDANYACAGVSYPDGGRDLRPQRGFSPPDWFPINLEFPPMKQSADFARFRDYPQITQITQIF